MDKVGLFMVFFGPISSIFDSATFAVMWFALGASRPSAALALTTLITILLGILLPYTPVGASLNLQPLPGIFFAWLASILVGFAILTQLMKRFFVKRFGWF